MIFLSAGIPSPKPKEGREFFGKGNVPAIRESVMAFTRVCMEYHIPFCFGGQPAISPLVYEIAKNFGAEFASNVKIYQSAFFKGKTPKEVSYFKNIEWTKIVDDKDWRPNVASMREIMLGQKLQCAVFIGGMDGIIDEAKMFHRLHPDAEMISVPNTGGATSVLKDRTKLDFITLPNNYAYVSSFKKYLLKYKNNG